MARGHRALRWVEQLLIFGGVVALGWCAFVFSDAVLYQRLALDTLRTTGIVSDLPADSVASSSDVEVTSAPVGAPVAEIEIPRLHLSAAVLEGSDDRTLRRGPGHIEHTAWPGDAGNIGIAGHRDTFFRPLQGARVGDDILLSTSRGRSVYRVSSIRIVPPSEVSVLAQTSEPVLTLVTCYPFSYVGAAPMRFIVRATSVKADGPID